MLFNFRTNDITFWATSRAKTKTTLYALMFSLLLDFSHGWCHTIFYIYSKIVSSIGHLSARSEQKLFIQLAKFIRFSIFNDIIYYIDVIFYIQSGFNSELWRIVLCINYKFYVLIFMVSNYSQNGRSVHFNEKNWWIYCKK